MSELMLGDLLALGRRSSSDLSAWLSTHDPLAAQCLSEEAERRNESQAQFLRIAVSDFLAQADEEAWASLISGLRDAGDPGAACAARMIAFRIRQEAQP